MTSDNPVSAGRLPTRPSLIGSRLNQDLHQPFHIEHVGLVIKQTYPAVTVHQRHLGADQALLRYKDFYVTG